MINPNEQNTNGNHRMPRRLAQRFIEQIRSGNWVTGQRLPTIRHLAMEYHVAPCTVGEAMRQLREEGWITSRQGSGSYVNPLEQWLNADNHQTPRVDPLLEEKESPEPFLHFLFHLDDKQEHSLYTEIICQMQEEAEAVKWRLRIGNALKINEILSNATTENTKGVIYMPDSLHPRDLDWPQLQFPRVLFSLGEKSLDSNYVTPDNYYGGCLAARYLLERTNSLLAITNQSHPEQYLGERPFRDRQSGFRDICLFRKLPEPEVLFFEEEEKLHLKMEQLMSLPRHKRPGIAFFGSVPMSESMATFGKWFPGAQLEEEFEIVFFQDYETRTDLPYATINFSRRVLCQEVIELVRRAEKHPEIQPLRIKIPMTLWPPCRKNTHSAGNHRKI